MVCTGGGAEQAEFRGCLQKPPAEAGLSGACLLLEDQIPSTTSRPASTAILCVYSFFILGTYLWR